VAISETAISKTQRITRNSQLAIQTESTYISESMTDVIKIPTANLRFATKVNSKKIFVGDSNNDRQPEMVAETGNTYS